MIIPISHYTCSNAKFNTCIYKNIDTKNYCVRIKIRTKTMERACIEIFFFSFAIFCISRK